MSNRPIVPPRLHPAICCKVLDLGGRVKLYWRLDKMNPSTCRPYVVGQRYTCGLGRAGLLRRHLESWLGRRLSPVELAGFDLERLLGAPCQVQVIHNTGPHGEVYANVAAVVPAGPGTPILSGQAAVFDSPTLGGNAFTRSVH